MSHQLTSASLLQLLKTYQGQTFISLFFGCRVNASESNQISQIFLNHGLIQLSQQSVSPPKLIVVNTCSITQKGENESVRKIKSLRNFYPKALIIVTGCASVPTSLDVYFLKNSQKYLFLKKVNFYSPQVQDRLTKYHRYLLNVQSGCNQFCTYCIVPYKRQQLWSLPIGDAVLQAQKAIDFGFKEIIITGVNLEKYTPGLTNLLKALLTQTNVPLISFGSLPINCIDNNFLNLFKKNKLRIKNFFHIPIQSGSDKILKLMHRPYNKQKIIKTIENCKLKIENLNLGTDIIVGFPGETEKDFQHTYNLCQQIGFTKIHTFRYSPRPNTLASNLPQTVNSQTKKLRSQYIRSLTCQTKPLSHQK